MRSRPLFIAPLIPFVAILGIFGVERFHGTKYLNAFVVVWCMVFAGLFSYVLKQVLEAKRTRKGKR